MVRMKYIWIAFKILVGSFFVFVVYQIYKNSLLQKPHKTLREYAKSERHSETKHIVFWTKFFGKNWLKSETYDQKYLESLDCPNTNCIFTHNKSYLKHAHEYDAIIFHGVEKWKDIELPRTRLPSQVYIMATLE